MKKLITYSILAAITLLSACRKDDNPNVPELARVPVPSITIDRTANVSISALAPLTFTGKFTVDLFFKDDVKPSKMDVVVRKNGVNSNTKLVMAGITTFPTIVTVTGAQIASLFGATPVLGDTYDFGVDIYTADGTKYEAFPQIGEAYGSGVPGQFGGVNLIASYGVLCVYNPDDYDGNFVVVSDAWEDTQPGDVIKFTKIDATHFSFIYPSVISPVPIIVAVNPDNTVTIAKQSIGVRFNYGPAYVLPTVRTLGSPNFVAPCDKTITFNLVWGFQGGEYGPYGFKLKKQ